jgi:SAM-dependent methyltransferase
MGGRLEPKRDVIQEISPHDVMHKSAPNDYFFWGSEGLATVERFMSLANLSTVKTILDFPSGHGRVLRFLRAAFPDAVITACDIDRDAVDFCARTFDARPVYSTGDLTSVALDGSYDVIWCGSLLTHMHAHQWRDLLDLFSAHLSDSGLLVFTTHGRRLANRLRSKQTTLGLPDRGVRSILSDYDQFGFGYQNYSGQDGWGISLSSASWVCSQIVQTSALRLAGYQEGARRPTRGPTAGWGGLQDAVACVSSKDDVP